MWTGSATDLGRILRLVQKQYEPLIEDHVASATKHPRQMLGIATAHKSFLEENRSDSSDSTQLVKVVAEIEERAKALEESEAEARNAGRIDLTVTGREDERRAVTGTASEIVEYLDGRHINALEFSAPSGSIRNHTITIRADRKDGIYARASSTDARWCIAAFAELSDEIKKQVPRWPFLRNVFFLYLAYTVMFGVALWYLADTVAIWTMPGQKFTREVSSAISTILGWVAPALAFGAVYLTRRLIPAFEVVETGKASRGKRMMASIGSVLAAVVLAVVGNAVSKAVLGS